MEDEDYLTTPALRVNNAYTLPTADGTAGDHISTNGAGTVTWETLNYGEMYTVDNTNATTVNSTSEWHAVTADVSEGYTNGFTYDAGSTGAITNTADNGGVLRCTDATHGLVDGDYITMQMANTAHSGITIVDEIDANTFDATNITYNSINDTGTWQQGASLTADAGTSGKFKGSWAASGISETNAHVFDFTPCLNITVATKAKARRNS